MVWDLSRDREQELRSRYGACAKLRWFAFFLLTGGVSFLVGMSVCVFADPPNPLAYATIYGMFGLGVSVSMVSGHVKAALFEYFLRNVVGYNACIYTYGEKNVGVMTLKRGSETNMHIAANNAEQFVVIPLGGWFVGKPRVQFGFGGDLAPIHQLKLKEDRRRPFHVWIEDKEGARLSFGPVSLLKFIQRIRSVSYSNTWRDALELLFHHHDQLAASESALSDWKRQYEGSLSRVYYVIDCWIAQIDGGDRLPYTKEGQELRERIAHFRLATLPDEDPRRAVLETPPRRRTRGKKGAVTA